MDPDTWSKRGATEPLEDPQMLLEKETSESREKSAEMVKNKNIENHTMVIQKKEKIYSLDKRQNFYQCIYLPCM